MDFFLFLSFLFSRSCTPMTMEAAPDRCNIMDGKSLDIRKTPMCGRGNGKTFPVLIGGICGSRSDPCSPPSSPRPWPDAISILKGTYRKSRPRRDLASSGMDHQARSAPESSVSVFDDVPVHKDVPKRPCPAKPVDFVAPSSPTGESTPVIPKDPRTSKKAHKEWRRLDDSACNPQENPHTPLQPSQVPGDKNPSTAKATSHFPKPRSFKSSPRTRRYQNRHKKSSSAEAAVFQSDALSYPTFTPTRFSGNVEGTSQPFTSTPPNLRDKTRHIKSSSAEAAILQPGAVSHPTLTPMRSSRDDGGTSQPLTHLPYPEPSQHTPEVQGQCFDTPRTLLPGMPTSVRDSVDLKQRFSSPPVHSIDNSGVYDNAQNFEQGESNTEYSQSSHFDPYTTPQIANPAPNATDLHHNGNMYTHDTNGYGPTYYSNHSNPSHPVHFYPLYIDYAGLIKT